MKKQTFLAALASLAIFGIPVTAILFGTGASTAPPPIVRNYFTTNAGLTLNSLSGSYVKTAGGQGTNNYFTNISVYDLRMPFGNGLEYVWTNRTTHPELWYYDANEIPPWIGGAAVFELNGESVFIRNLVSTNLVLSNGQTANFGDYTELIHTADNIFHISNRLTGLSFDFGTQFKANTQVKGSTPLETNDFTTKAYVDGLSQFALKYYFHGQTNSLITNGAYYRQMWRSDVPIAPIFTNTFPGLTLDSNNQYVVAYTAPSNGLSQWLLGDYHIKFFMFWTGVGSPSLSIQPELYRRLVNGQEIEIGTSTPHPIGAFGEYEHDVIVQVTTNVTVNPTDSLVVKFKLFNVTGTVELKSVSQGGTAAGVNQPVGSSAFVNKGGDTMTGGLTVPTLVVNNNAQYLLTTNTTIGDVTNFVADFQRSYSDLFAASDINIAHATNLTAGKWGSKVLKIYSGETNRQIWFPSTWKGIGSAATNYVVMSSNKVAIVSLASDGSNQTNVCYVYAVQP